MKDGDVAIGELAQSVVGWPAIIMFESRDLARRSQKKRKIAVNMPRA